MIGLAFYVGVSVAIWIEGVPALVRHETSMQDFQLNAPSLRTLFSLVLFILASGIQHDCHAYLASLKRPRDKRDNSKSSGTQKAGVEQQQQSYKLPTHPAFNVVLTPHYLMECIIYVSLAILDAPTGQWCNFTLLCALAFVVINLGVTAVGTHDWYRRNFGRAAVQGKWAMIPWIV